MKIKNATVLFVLVPFILGTILLIYCIWAVSTNKNFSIRETIPVGKAKLVWYTEKVKGSDVPVTHLQCIGSRKIFDPHQKRYDIFIAEGKPDLSFELNAVAVEDTTNVTITITPEADRNDICIIRQKTEAHGITFIWK